MPPPVPTESELESESEHQEWSDDESVSSIRNAPISQPQANGEEPSESSSEPSSPPRLVRPGSSQRHTNHATGVLASAANMKRKADSPDSDDDDRVTKTRRTDSSQDESAKSDYSEDDDGDDLEDIPFHADYVKQSFSADMMPASNGAASVPSLHPSHPKNALTLFKRMFPHLSPPERPMGLFTHLGSQPVLRTPVVTHRFNDSKPQNIPAWLMQATGDEVPLSEACARCARQSGVIREACIVVHHPTVLDITGGACANCWYNRQGSQCSFRETVEVQHKKSVDASRKLASQKTSRHSSAQETPSEVPAPPPVPAAPAAAPLHPSYAAALASGAVVATRSLPPAQSNGVSREDKVKVWERRYDSMSVENLLQAHEHLAEWQEDLTTRLMAMNRVVLEKLLEREERN